MSHSAGLARLTSKERPHQGASHETETEPVHGCTRSYADIDRFQSGALKGNLKDRLMELVEIQASQVNGCAHCLSMRTAAARR
jgi:alkylhydroperoxidase family enzyme